jgi:hypothetical protein
MADDYSKGLCDERHKNIDGDVKALFDKYDYLHQCITQKFNSIMIGIFTTLLTVIASLVVLALKIKAIG